MTPVHAVTPADLELLRKFDTPTICNVVELFDMRPRTAGYMNARIQACYPKLPPMVGYASTATFRSSAPPRAGNVYSGLAEQVASFAEFPGPVVRGSPVNWTDQMTSEFFSLPKVHKSEYFGSSENNPELMTFFASSAAFAMSPGAARVR